jgi:hypothetical protein
MSRVHPQLTLSIVWADADIKEVEAQVRSENFSGATTFYASSGELDELGRRLAGFPNSSADKRVFDFGEANQFNYGQAKLTFKCRDSVGHLIAKVEIQETVFGAAGESEVCTALLYIVPSDIDRFVAALRGTHEVGHVATLQNAA